MEEKLDFWVAGGDLRQVWLARLLAGEGHTVHTFALGEQSPAPGLLLEEGLEGIGGADCVVLPMPVSSGDGALSAPLSPLRRPLAPLLDRLSPGQFLCGGRIDPGTQAMAGERGLTIADYSSREEFAVANAVPTAEGAVQLAMERLPITVHGARVLVIGFGRVGVLTAQRFAALGARVTAAARREEPLAWARAMGLDAEPLGSLSGRLREYDLVVNTVPSPILGRGELERLKPDCLILDLASRPGGVDRAAAGELGLEAVWALALPGRVAPAAAGKALKNTICPMLREWSESALRR